MTQSHLDPGKLDSFSIGLTVLDMILLRSNEDLYGSGCRSFDKRELSSRVSSIQGLPGRNYHPWLEHLVEFMTQPLPATRNSTSETLGLMSPYARQIENMQPFQPTYNKSHGPLMDAQQRTSR